MEITGTLILPPDAELIPVADLSAEVRRQVQADEGDYAVTRPRFRVTTRVVNGDAAALLQEFRKPSTVIQAVLRYCKATKEEPESTLDAAFPLLEQLVKARLLVSPDSPDAQSVKARLEPGSRYAGVEIMEAISVLHDTEVYRVRTAAGEIAALKVLLCPQESPVGQMFEREATNLKHLDGKVSPKLLDQGTADGSHYLLLSWCEGKDCASVAARLRASGDQDGLVRLCLAILGAYAELHREGVLHGDVHPGNILVDDELAVRLIDFGLARVAALEREAERVPRGGVGWYFEPEYAEAQRARKPEVAANPLGEQYSVAALLYTLFTGKAYADFSLEGDEMLRQIAEDDPLPFSAHGLPPWPSLEERLAKALSKRPSARFDSLNSFADAMASVGEPPASYSALPRLESSLQSARDLLERVLERYDLRGPALHADLIAAPKASVNYGSAGVACGLLRIAGAREDARVLAMADLWGERCLRDAALDDAWYAPALEIDEEKIGRISPYHTQAGVHLVRGLIAHGMGDVFTQQESLDGFVAASAAPEFRRSSDALDLTLGRSGTLLAAAQLLSASAGDVFVSAAGVRELGERTVASLWEELDALPAIRECRSVAYMGMAHGWAGMLYATLCWSRASGAALPATVEERLDQLAGLAKRSGGMARWSSHVGTDDSFGPLSASWCNGAAGQVFLWLAAFEACKENRYRVLAEEAGRYASDAMVGNGSLCCGTAGQAYALLALYRATGERGWLMRARELTEAAAVAFQGRPASGETALAQPFDSLFKGALGVAVLAADLENPDFSSFPAFEFL